MNGHHIDTHTPVEAVLVDEEGNMMNDGKPVTLMKANHHSGIGPVDDGIPYALRTTVDDSKNWYKSMFNKVHRLSRNGEDENSNFIETDVGNPYRTRHSSIERPVRIGSIFDYQPGDEYVVENKPVKHNPDQSTPTPTHQVDNISVTTTNNNKISAPTTKSPKTTTNNPATTRFSFDKPLHQPRVRPSSYHTSINQLHPTTSYNNRYSMNLSSNNQMMTSSNQQHNRGNSMSNLPTAVMLSEDEWLTFFDNNFLYLPPSGGDNDDERQNEGPQQQRHGGSTTAQSSSSSSHNSDVFVRKTEAARRSSWIDHQNKLQQQKSTTDEVFADSNEMTTKTQQKTTSNINGNVKFDFGGQTQRELSVKKGEKIKIIHKKDENWFMCENKSGKQGIVPINYVEIIVPEIIEQKISTICGQATAKFDFVGNSKRELPFKKGDQLELVKKIDNNWYRAKIGENNGIVPVTYITVISEPQQESPKKIQIHVPEVPIINKPPSKSSSPRMTSSSTTSPHVTSSSTTSPSVVGNIQHENISISKEDEPAENERKNRAAFLANNVVTNQRKLKSIENSPIQYEFDLSELEDVVQSFDEISTPRSDVITSRDDSEYGDVIGRFITQFPYQACNEDELDLQLDDVTHVVEICDDGWYVGTCERTRKFGTFPGNFVKPI